MTDSSSIDRAADEVEIRNTLAELAWLADSKSMDDIEPYVDCFTPDAVWEGPGGDTRTGRDDIRAGVTERRAGASPDAAVLHFVASTAVSFDDDDNARVRSYIQAMRVVKGEPPLVVLLGRYHDHFRRTPRGWKLHRRRIEVA